MFHAHHDEMTQMGMGLIGMFVVHPRNPSPDYRVDRDFSLMISEWSVKAGTCPSEHAGDDRLQRPDDQRQGVSLDGAAGLQDRRSGQAFAWATWAPWTTTRCTSTGTTSASPRPTARTSRCRRSGRRRPSWSRWGRPATSSSSPMRPGDWAFHCHMTHHVMNQMGHEFPNMVGMKPERSGREDPPAPPGVHDAWAHAGWTWARWPRSCRIPGTPSR